MFIINNFSQNSTMGTLGPNRTTSIHYIVKTTLEYNFFCGTCQMMVGRHMLEQSLSSKRHMFLQLHMDKKFHSSDSGHDCGVDAQHILQDMHHKQASILYKNENFESSMVERIDAFHVRIS